MHHIVHTRSEATYQLDARVSRPGLLAVRLVDNHWLDCCRYQPCRACVLLKVFARSRPSQATTDCGFFNLAASCLAVPRGGEHASTLSSAWGPRLRVRSKGLACASAAYATMFSRGYHCLFCSHVKMYDMYG
ncbi:unnamed protein product [Ectocarpus sp. 4 AP-2014]